MKTPREIIDNLGVDAIAARVDVHRKRVQRARYGDTLPASWYLALCDMAGADLPVAIFSFKGQDAVQ